MNSLLDDLLKLGDLAHKHGDDETIRAYVHLRQALSWPMLAILEDAPKIDALIKSEDSTACKQLEIQILRTVNRAMRS